MIRCQRFLAVVAKGWMRMAIILSLFVLSLSTAFAQISITSLNSPATQNFDGMGSAGTTFPSNWTAVRYAGTGTVGATLTLIVDNGSGNSGGIYNVGSSGSNERALGTLSSGSTMPAFGAQYINNTGATITDFQLSGMMEQWRSGSSSSANEVVVFEYSLNATSLMTGTWVAVTGMNFNEILTSTTTAGAVDGNSSANRASISASVSGISWANSGTMWIRWRDNDDGGSDGMYAIDDFSFTAGAPTGDGSGTATIDPDTLSHGVSYTMAIAYVRNPSFTITDMRFILPASFTWSHTTGDVSFTNMTATKSVSGDTVYLTSLSMSSDTTVISIQSVTPSDSTAFYPVKIQTKVSSSYTDISPTPQVLVFGVPVPISSIKVNDANGIPLRQGQLVTIHGIVTVGHEFGDLGPAYVQDSTAGIGIFGTAFTGWVSIGYEVVVTGTVSPFNGLAELGSPVLNEIVSSGNTIEPLLVTASQISGDGAGGVEQYEGMLVRIDSTVVRTYAGATIPAWAVSGSGINYRLGVAPDTVSIRVDNNVNFANGPAPQGTFSVIGVVGQFKPASPFIGGYQFMPRMSADILTPGPVIATQPHESNVTTNSFTISWTTVNPGTSRLRYGRTLGYELGTIVPDNVLRTSHSTDVTGLLPATIYHAQAFSDDASGDTSFAGDLIVSTSPPAGTTGQINVYFNKSVNTSVSLGEDALGNQDLVAKVVNRIDSAKWSIDLALYSLSGSSYGDVIATHLVSAKNRGVKVRAICEHDNRGGTGFTILQNGGITLIDDAYDAVWNGQGLSHNKFFVFDYRGGAPESIWVWGGSWNPTQPGTSSDRQNAIEIQDVSIAGAYTTEFEEMWGSNTETPNATNSRFGARKTDNTPHNFTVNGIPISVYFSPSDHTTSYITSTIGQAQHSVSTAVLSFTRKEIADSIISKKNAGHKTRVLVDNNTDQGNQFSYMQTNGVDIHLKGGSGLLHHKYTVVDGDQSAGTAYAITGSHNYSTSAETKNDENTIIIQDHRTANLYLQEFAARYYEAGGTDSIHVSSSPIISLNRSSINFDSVAISASKQDSFLVSNIGNGSLTVSLVTSTNVRFAVNPENAFIAPSSSQKFYVTFSPTSVGSQSGSIIITHDAPGSPDSVNVQGVGTGVPIFGVSPVSMNFDTLIIGQSKQDSFVVSNTGNGPLTISSAASSNAKFSVTPGSATVSASASKTFYLTFSPTGYGAQSSLIILTHNAAGSPDTVSASGFGRYGDSACVPVAQSAGWNMVSVPVKLSNNAKTAIFPSALSNAFKYQGGYVTSDTLDNRHSYWLKFASSRIDTFCGLPIASDTFCLTPKWNMVGAISCPVAVSSISDPGNIVVGDKYFGYGPSGYFMASTLEPGRGYWVKASSAGCIALTCSGSLAKEPLPMVFMQMDQLTITDAEGRQQTLYVGPAKSAISVEEYELPPAPPQGMFDIRYESGRFAEFYDENLIHPAEFRIALQGSKFPIKVSWSIATNELNYYNLSVPGTRNRLGVTLKDKGETTLYGNEISSLLLSVAQSQRAPQEFSLGQNYPNPFNPATTIAFALPKQSSVTLKIYDALGRIVNTMIDQESYDAGYHDVHVDATELASGIYFYQLSAVSYEQGALSTFQQVKKFLVIK